MLTLERYLNNPNAYYIKVGVEPHEYKCHKMIYNLEKFNVPKIYHYDKEEKIMVIQKIHGSNIADFYGEEPENTPSEIFEEIRYIITELYKINIYYPDITGYNFIQDKFTEKIWICDFEHVKCSSRFPKEFSFIKEFINGKNKWNPEFK